MSQEKEIPAADRAIPAWIAWRLERAPGLSSSCRILTAVEARDRHALAWKDRDLPVAEVVDLRDVHRDVGTQALERQALSPATDVVVTYASDPEDAIGMTWATFTEFWDDVWYPASDDVRIIGLDGAPIVEIDHEEQLSIIQRTVGSQQARPSETA